MLLRQGEGAGIVHTAASEEAEEEKLPETVLLVRVREARC